MDDTDIEESLENTIEVENMDEKAARMRKSLLEADEKMKKERKTSHIDPVTWNREMTI